MRELLAELRAAYGCQVEVEFTANVYADGSHKINLLQCRPLPVVESDSDVHAPTVVAPEDLLLHARGAVLGRGRVISLARLVYVVPSAYGRLGTRDRYRVARLVGKLNHLSGQSRAERVMLMGPGRWGTRLPELGVPVAIGEISTVSVLCEIDAMHEGLTPDLSLGTHFFHEVTELDMLYLGYAMAREDNVLNERLLLEAPNRLPELLPDETALGDVVRVIHPSAGTQLVLTADPFAREALLFFDR
jgi:pyruvate, water dikinase